MQNMEIKTPTKYDFGVEFGDLYCSIDEICTNKSSQGYAQLRKILEKVRGLLFCMRFRSRNETESLVREIIAMPILPNAFSSDPKIMSVDLVMAFRNVISGICDYVSDPVAHEERILTPLKQWKILTAKTKFDKMKYAVMPVSYFKAKQK